MRSIVAILTIMLLAVPAFAMADFSSADEPLEFWDDDNDPVLKYRVIKDNEVQVCELYEDYTGESLTINKTITHDAITYDIVSMDVYFENGSIETIYIPKTISKINDGCFGIPTLQSITVEDGCANYSSIDGVLYEKKNGVENRLLVCPMSKPGESYTEIPGTVSEIAQYAFTSTDFETIKLNDGIIKIGSFAFYRCSNLVNIKSNLGDNTLPESVSSIGSFAFSDCTKLQVLNLPEGLEYIGACAFSNSGLTAVHIPLYTDFIGESAFADCSGITKFTSDNLDYPVDDGGVLYAIGRGDMKSIFAYPAARTDETFTIPEDVSDIYSDAFSGCTHLKEVVLNDYFLDIPDQAFMNCKSLERIDISKVVSIGMSAFNGCENLSNIELGKDLTTVWDAAFFNCNLKTLTIPASVLYIGDGAFKSCANLKEVTIEEGSKVKIYEGAFADDRALEKITIASKDVTLLENSLAITYDDGDPFTLNVEVVKGYSIPDNAANAATKLNVSVIGERPYPWENWIGVFFCALVVIGILLAVREV